jgi:endonuclease/exonuclease/phosphatase family metal-dependent hydrolase
MNKYCVSESPEPVSAIRRLISFARHRIAAVLLSIALAALIVKPIPVHSADGNNQGVVRVMTQNMDEGSDFEELRAAKTPTEVFAAVTTIYHNILATQPAERAAAMAREIANKRPDLIALHEASMLRIGPLFAPTPSATTVKMDLIKSLLDELDKLGEHYALAGTITNLDAEAPSITLGFDVRITDRDAIIVRTDIDMITIDRGSQYFSTVQTVPSPVGPTTIPGGWVFLDAIIRGQPLRFVSVHLDPGPSILIQVLQAKELVQTAGATTLPIVFGGDFNTTANDPSNPTYSVYQALISGGLKDAWKRTEPGFTCCQDGDLLNAQSKLSYRIDLILYLGDFSVADIVLVGDQPADKTPSGLWPSDHAGVVATLDGQNGQGNQNRQGNQNGQGNGQ